MDLVPDSAGRDGSGPDGYPRRNHATGGHQAVPINGASHRATGERHHVEPTDHATPESVVAHAAADPSIADHPLLRGLLAELPERDGALPDGWLDHWLEAARAVLELLYSRRPSAH